MDEARTVSDDDCRIRSDMASGLSKEPSRFLLILKWGGCFTALVFAVGGLLLDIASPGDVYESLIRGSWMPAIKAGFVEPLGNLSAPTEVGAFFLPLCDIQFS